MAQLRGARAAGALLLLACALLVLFSKAGAWALTAPLVDREWSDAPPGRAEAIVVIGNADSRLRRAAALHHLTKLPVLVSGGADDHEGRPEAYWMSHRLRTEFSVEPRWSEGKSRNTAENASHSAAVLRPAGVNRVLLVTDAVHMRRAAWMFTLQGMQATPAPAATVAPPQSVSDLFPTAAGARATLDAVHEWGGLLWYSLRY